MAFYGFLRCGEYTTKSLSFNPYHNLTFSDLTLKEHMYYNIPETLKVW